MLIDTHAHLNFDAYKNNRDLVVKKALDGNIWIINVGSKYETSKKAMELAEKYEKGVYAAIGLHPIHSTPDFVKKRIESQEGGFLASGEAFDKKRYKELAQSKKAVAIGEIGLDYYYRPKTKNRIELFKEKQKETLSEQLNLAEELNLPVILHCRMAHDDLMGVLGSRPWNLNGVIHCFTGTQEQAEKYMELGFYLGFNGIIFKFDLNEVIKRTPLDKILIETDCPYLTPPQEGDKRNEPIFVKHIARRIAEIKRLDYKKVAEITTLNAKNLFKI